ncbi:hypothetical protein PS1_000383 [Malus domestica]
MDCDKFINLLHNLDPIKVELNRLENEVRDVNAARSPAFLEICNRFSQDLPLNLVGGAHFFDLTGPSKRMRVRWWSRRRREGRKGLGL